MDALRIISAQLAALSGAQRLHRLTLPGAGELVVERWSGEESLSTHFNYVIDFLSLELEKLKRMHLKFKILKTRDFRGSLGLKHQDEIVELEDQDLIKQFIGQGLIQEIVDRKSNTIYSVDKEVEVVVENKNKE